MLIRCPYCRTGVAWGLLKCPRCDARISYGCRVPVTGFFLTVVVGFLTAASLIPFLSSRDPAGHAGVSDAALAGIGSFALLVSAALWFLMVRMSRKFVSFSRRPTDR